MDNGIKFNGLRLKEARIARGLSVTQLAELSGVKKQSISNYENGKQSPRADALSILAEKLSVEVPFFYRDSFACSQSPIFFRSRKGLARKEWERAEIKLGWFEEILAYFNDVINFVPQRIPSQFDISDRIGSISRGEIEDIALACRKEWGLGVGPISNLTRLLENNGVIVIKMPLDVKEEDAFSQWQLNESIPVAVMVAEDPSACRDRFSLAHELGHLVMHRNIEVKPENLNTLEEQANNFASSFLLPAESYFREFRYPSLETFKILKDRWRVSIKSQIYRCKEVGVITESSSKYFYMNVAKRKWTKVEPLDDVIPFEEPNVIKKTLDILEQQANITLFDISAATGISEADIASLCGVSVSEKASEPVLPTLRSASPKVIPFPKRA